MKCRAGMTSEAHYNERTDADDGRRQGLLQMQQAMTNPNKTLICLTDALCCHVDNSSSTGDVPLHS